MSKNTRNRILLTAVAALLLMCVAVGGTLAWLSDDSPTVTNTFKGSSLEIDMWESPLKTGDEYDGKTIDTTATDVKSESNYKMVPGVTLQKDPYAVVTAGSEPCYIFVVVTKGNNFDKFFETVNYNTTDWALVEGYTNVYAYNEKINALNSTTDVPTSSILVADSALKVNTGLSVSDLDLTADKYPTLTFKAYAIQSEYLTDGYTIEDNAAEIWKLLNVTEGVIEAGN